ncbi:DNA polymerase I [soil metagenome]
MNTLVLIDGHSNVYKAFHAIATPLMNAKGEPTGAVFGFLNIFQRLQKQIDMQHVVVVFDPPGPSFRRGIYSDYKANRPPAPVDLISQDKRIREMLELMGVPMIEVPNFEADDVLGCLAVQAVRAGGEAMVCSVDKDLLQIVRPGIKVWRDHLQRQEVLDEAGVVEKMGVRPDQIPAYLGLVGDSSDNIPGVPGVGPKTAVTLLKEYGTIEAILAAAPGMKQNKLSANLQEHALAARLSEQLATLNYECVGDFDWERFQWDYQPSEELNAFFREMGFNSQLQTSEQGPAPELKTVEQRDTNYRTVRTRAALEDAAKEIRATGLASIDTETTDLDPFTAELVGISISWAQNQAIYIPVGHHTKEEQLPLADAIAVLKPLLNDTSVKWVAHNWVFDLKILQRAGFDPGPISSDTMIASFLLNPERANSIGLKDMAAQWLGIKMTSISELIGEGGDMVTMAGVTIEDSSRYACQDADVTLQLHNLFLPKLKEAGLLPIFEEIELPLIPVIAAMELEGVAIDRAHFGQLSTDTEKDMERIALEIFRIAGRQFKINSPKQVGELLFDELKLPGKKKGKSGAYSTDVTVLEALKNEHPLPAKLLDYRQVEKLKNTYIDPLPGMVNVKTGRVHTSYSQTIAATGRLSSSNPNLQNIPIRSEAGLRVRRGFVARQPGWKLVSADYSQIELRILAHISGDAALREAFASGGDIHILTASKIFNVPLSEVTSTQRNSANTINFGIVYGMSDFRLGRDLGISRATAKQFIEDYFRVYAGIQRYIEETKESTRRTGFVTTLRGRRRFIPDINARNMNIRNGAERIAVNTPIQGSSADMIKLAMIRVAKRLREDGYRAQMILQVHDELIFDSPDEEVDRLIEMVKLEMAEALPLDVPVKVEASAATNWADA